MSDERPPEDPPATDAASPEPSPEPDAPRGLRSAAWTDASPVASPGTPAAAAPEAAPADAPKAAPADAAPATTPPASQAATSTEPTVETPAEDLDFRQRATLLADHHTWLERPSTIRGLKWGSLALLAATVAAEAALIPDPKAHFEGIDGWVGFHAVYGFVTCVAMVLGAKFVLGSVLKRKDTYYDG